METKIIGFNGIYRNNHSDFDILPVEPRLQCDGKLLDADIGAIPSDYKSVYVFVIFHPVLECFFKETIGGVFGDEGVPPDCLQFVNDICFSGTCQTLLFAHVDIHILLH